MENKEFETVEIDPDVLVECEKGLRKVDTLGGR